MEIKHVLGVAALFVVCLTLQAECMLFTKDAECHRLRTKLDDIRPRCFYMCHMPDGQLRMGAEEDGTPCRQFFGRTGSCNSGLCIPEEMRKYLEERKRRIEERRRRIDGDKKTGGGADKGTDDNSASTPPAS